MLVAAVLLLAGCADLAVRRMGYELQSADGHDQAAVTVVVVNEPFGYQAPGGTVDAGPSTLRVSCPCGVEGPPPSAIEIFGDVPALPVGASHTHTVVLPLLEPGTHTVTAEADYDGQVAEYSITNNIAELTIESRPDLIVEDLSIAPPNPYTHLRFDITATVKNVGNATAALSRLRIECGEEDTGTVRQVRALSPGGAFDTTRSCQKVSPGIVTIRATADLWSDLDESNETNNETALSVDVLQALIWRSVTAGEAHSCGLTWSDVAYCWGTNGSGRLGDSTETDSLIPVAVWGGHNFASVSAGAEHSCGVTTAGAAYCWGSNQAGQLGSGSADPLSSTPVAVAGGHAFAVVSAGDEHSCGITTAGQAYCWGSNQAGRLGDGTTTDSSTPVAVDAGGQLFTTVSAGAAHSCAVATTGAGYCWGANAWGQLGDGTTTESATPVAVTGGHGFAVVSAGGEHTCAKTPSPDNSLLCWGRNHLGQLGTVSAFDTAPHTSPAHVNIGGIVISDAIAVSAGADHSCAIRSGGTLSCWGGNNLGQLGSGGQTCGTSACGPEPQGVGVMSTTADVGAGGLHSCAVGTLAYSGNYMHCWGENEGGALGNGQTSNSATPVMVAEP